MQYLGGKSRLAKRISEAIRTTNPNPKRIWEPFCGGAGATVGLAKAFPNSMVMASDWSADLMDAIKYLDDGGEIVWRHSRTADIGRHTLEELLLRLHRRIWRG